MVACVAPPCWLLIGQETSSGWSGPLDLQLLPVATIFFLTVGSPVVRLVIVVCYWWVSGEDDLFCGRSFAFTADLQPPHTMHGVIPFPVVAGS